MIEKRYITTVKKGQIKLNVGGLFLPDFENGTEVEVVVRRLEDSHINSPYCSIVRYKKDGSYDCVWQNGLTRREAEKRVEKLNSDYHKNYGTYVIEESR